MSLNSFLLICLLILKVLVLIAGAQTKVPAIIVFGDSTVDAGNNNQIKTIARCNFEPYGRDFEGGKPTGRFSNGRVVSDFISEAFGIKPSVPAYLDPEFSIKDLATGVTFASAATGYDNATADILSVIPLWKQLEYFKEYKRRLVHYQGTKNAMETIHEAIYIVSVGTNDFIENYYSMMGRTKSRYTIEEYQYFLIGLAEKFLLDLFRLGARKMSLGGIPPMGCLPLERTTNFMSEGSCREDYNKVAREFSAKCQGLAAKLRNQFPELRVAYTNAYDPILEAIEKPHLYGFEVVDLGCCGTGLFEASYLLCKSNPYTCPDANKYVFWDSIHGTDKLNGIVADSMLKTSLAEFI